MRKSELMRLLEAIEGDPPVLVWSESIGGNINLEPDAIEHYTPKGGKASVIINPG